MSKQKRQKNTALDEIQRRKQELLDTAPTPEHREFAEYAFNPETFERFLQETGEKVTLKAQDVWDAYPLFVQDRYGDNQPFMVSQSKEVSGEFYTWLLDNPAYDFYLVEGKKDQETWLNDVVELCVDRRIMQYKYILYEEYGKDTFADREVRDKVVAYMRAHHESLGQ